MSRRVVILTNGGLLGKAACRVLRERGIIADALLVFVRRPVRGGAREHVKELAAYSRGWLRARRDDTMRHAAREYRITGRLNTPRMIRDLQALRPDAVVLAGCSLLGDDVLRVPVEGVYNVHPALLPWIRGSSPARYTLARDVPLGATAFRVDPGIDTGRILERRLLPVAGGESYQQLQTALFELWLDMTAGLVRAAIAGPLPQGLAQTARFPFCPKLPPGVLQAETERLVDEGVPLRLFNAWKHHCDEALRLPADRELP